MNKQGKIGIFDSGIGGVTVLKEIIKLLPKEEYLYYSDSKNNPYGDKTEKEVIEICDTIVRNLIENECKIIVIACNTASAKAARFLRQKYPDIPFVAIEPAYKMVYDNAYEEETLVMATKGTIESEKFKLLLTKYNNHKTYLLSCIGLADRIEKGNKEEIKKYLQENLQEYRGKVKNVVLGCTHYPLIQKEITEVLGEVKFFNGAGRLAVHLKEILKEMDGFHDGKGKITFMDSSEQEKEEKEKRFYEILGKIGK